MTPTKISAQQLKKSVVSLLADTISVAKDLYVVLIPAIIIVKIFQEVGLITQLATLLEPLMQIFGLPGEMAIVWTTAMVTNIYGGIAVLMMLVGDLQLSVAQMSVLGTMILICHALPVELALTHRVGCHFLFLGPLRFFGACIAGVVLHNLYRISGTLNQPAVILWAKQKEEYSYFDWAINQFNSLIMIFFVLLALLTMMRLLTFLKITDVLAKLLKPVLILMGISQKGASIAVFGLLAGITFGSGLLLAETKKNEISARDVVLILAFLSLCHAVIEDTALMLLIGADISAILFFRLLFAIACLAIFSRLKFVDFTRLYCR